MAKKSIKPCFTTSVVDASLSEDAASVAKETTYIPDGEQTHYEYEQYYKKKCNTLRKELNQNKDSWHQREIDLTIQVERQSGEIVLLKRIGKEKWFLAVLNSFGGILLAVVSAFGPHIQSLWSNWPVAQAYIVGAGIILIVVYFFASSPESMGEFGFGELSKCVI